MQKYLITRPAGLVDQKGSTNRVGYQQGRD